jgi:hypothetical protein
MLVARFRVKDLMEVTEEFAQTELRENWKRKIPKHELTEFS